MDTIDLVVGTVEHFLLQGRVVVLLKDMDTLAVVRLGLLRLEHSPLEEARKGLLPVDKVPEGEGDVQYLLTERDGMLKWSLSTTEFFHPLLCLEFSSAF